MSDIYSLYDEVAGYGNHSPEYVDKMLHQIPPAPVFDRAQYIMKATKNKVVLDVGATGPMAVAVSDMACRYYAIDEKPISTDYKKINVYHRRNLDETVIKDMPDIPGLQIIVAGEVLEHVSNAGNLLDLLHSYGVQVILTTPNAFGKVGERYINRGIESVNKQHVAWYSYHTLKTLVERHGYRILLWAWYNGEPLTAEGLIFHMEPNNNGND